MYKTRSRRTGFALVGIAASATLLFAGCSSDNGDHDMGSMSHQSTATSAAPTASNTEQAAAFNDADVMFAQMMYPHHAQAVEMAQLVEGRTTTPEVVQLAEAIESAQGPEMEQLAQWLKQWGQPDPSAQGGDQGDMHHGDDTMSGMMSEREMTDLAAKSGTEFDQAWLAMMIEHHAGAIEMANAEIADGENLAAKQLATTIAATQQQEIDTMKSLQRS
ncbi:DUF305 domain-containing protein [Williamsia muralis]|uniref:DUF305 domain-containing protein n=1 Tax=Williamsia marianensis TaxID=85044 RepID=UPI000DE78FDE|nr:DUF305 domain-containing protein [Williamsia marianensis]PVY34218.1 uncharacterized protein (DUF305 family) [Williamsia marianensis]